MNTRIIRAKRDLPKTPQLPLGQLFFNLARKYHDRICQIDGDNDHRETYASVLARSTRLALSLQKRGIGKKDTVLICSKNTMDNLIPMLTSFYLGAKVVNADPRHLVHDANHMVNLTSPTVIFVEESATRLIETNLEDSQSKKIIVLGNSQKYETLADLIVPDPEEDKFEPAAIDLDEIAAIVWTSATTGHSKAVCHSHKSYLPMINFEFINEESTFLHFGTCAGICGLLMTMAVFAKGGTRVFSDNYDASAEIIAKHKVTSIFLPPIQAHQLNSKQHDTSSLRCIALAGTPVSFALWKQLSCLFKNITLFNIYGTSEIGLASDFSSEVKVPNGSPVVPTGMLFPGVTAKIVNPDTGEILGPNQKGEVYIKTPFIMKGYYELDSSNCFDQDGFYRTGDFGYYDDDEYLFVLERIKEVIKVASGYVIPARLEAVLLEHPAVKQPAVFGVCRDGQMVPTACVVLKNGFDVGKEEIEEFVNERVSDGEKLTGGVAVVKSIPTAQLGKVIRHNIANLYQQW